MKWFNLKLTLHPFWFFLSFCLFVCLCYQVIFKQKTRFQFQFYVYVYVLIQNFILKNYNIQLNLILISKIINDWYDISSFLFYKHEERNENNVSKFNTTTSFHFHLNRKWKKIIMLKSVQTTKVIIVDI
jgi:hypothetical protein